MVLGLGGLGAAWRLAAVSWHLPARIGELISLLAAAAWVVPLRALATDVVRFEAPAPASAVALLAPYLFVLVNVAIGAIALGTLWLLLRGHLIPLN